MSSNQSFLEAIKDLNAMEILALIAHAKTGEENAIAEAPDGAVNDAKEALEWLFEVMENKTE